eukprot:447587-Rhodomonas_salina.2
MSGTDIGYAATVLRVSGTEIGYATRTSNIRKDFREGAKGGGAGGPGGGALSTREVQHPLHPKIKYKKPHSWYKLYRTCSVVYWISGRIELRAHHAGAYAPRRCAAATARCRRAVLRERQACSTERAYSAVLRERTVQY